MKVSPTPLVSVVIPMFNNEKTLPKTLKSVYEQTYPNYEVILVDDYSTDNTVALVAELSRVHPLKLIKNSRNFGISYSRNVGVLHAKGEYISFLDADDLWDPTKMEKQINTMLKTGCDFVHCYYDNAWLDSNTFEIVHTIGQAKDIKGLNNAFRELFLGTSFTPSTTIFRKECLQRIGGFDIGLHSVSDADLYLRALMTGAYLELIPECLVTRTINGGNVSGGVYDRTFVGRLVLFTKWFNSELLKKYLKSQTISKEYTYTRLYVRAIFKDIMHEKTFLGLRKCLSLFRYSPKASLICAYLLIREDKDNSFWVSVLEEEYVVIKPTLEYSAKRLHEKEHLAKSSAERSSGIFKLIQYLH